jgi:phospho-N-acetylmuramoyl-pentapeptide-transferase
MIGLGAFVTAFLVSVTLGPLVIPLLRRWRLGQVIRQDGPTRHVAKAGTPTMGGLIFLPGWVLGTLAWGFFDPATLLVLSVGLGFGLLGLGDDYLKVYRRRSVGLRARQKLLGQVVLSLGAAALAVLYLGRGTGLSIPGTGGYWDLGYGFFPLAVLVVVGSSNAVNLTDGLDGLAAGIAAVSATAYAIITHLTGFPGLSVTTAALAGACLGFLIFNRYPARVFMGDTGSLAIGAILGTVALLTRTELVWLIIGGVYAWETFTVMLQVLSFKLTGRRIWRMTPYHHHLELGGWSEVKVVAVLWLVAALLAVSGLAIVFL